MRRMSCRNGVRRFFFACSVMAGMRSTSFTAPPSQWNVVSSTFVSSMQRRAAGRLRDLLAAAETISNDERVARRLAHLRQQYALADAHRDRVLFLLEAERAGHAAAAGVGVLDVETDVLEHRLLVVEVQ